MSLRNNWRRELEYDIDSRKLFIPLDIFDALLEERYIKRIRLRIGESAGNYIICGIGIRGITLNLHPDSKTKRFTIEGINI